MLKGTNRLVSSFNLVRIMGEVASASSGRRSEQNEAQRSRERSRNERHRPRVPQEILEPWFKSRIDKRKKEPTVWLVPFNLVRIMGLEPIRRSTHAPQTCLSAYSSTSANFTPFIAPDYYITHDLICQQLF